MEAFLTFLIGVILGACAAVYILLGFLKDEDGN